MSQFDLLYVLICIILGLIIGVVSVIGLQVGEKFLFFIIRYFLIHCIVMSTKKKFLYEFMEDFLRIYFIRKIFFRRFDGQFLWC